MPDRSPHTRLPLSVLRIALTTAALFAAACSSTSGTDAATDLATASDLGADALRDAGADAARSDLGADLGIDAATADLGVDAGPADLGVDAGPADLGTDLGPADAGPCVPADHDGDGFAAIACGGFDCDDTSASVHPGATETCNGIDDNCNGMTDEGLTLALYYPDCDGDGYGAVGSVPVEGCGAPAAAPSCGAGTGAWSTSATDCDDANARVHPGVAEACNGIDDDCSGTADDPFACIASTATTCVDVCAERIATTCTATCTLPACDLPTSLHYTASGTGIAPGCSSPTILTGARCAPLPSTPCYVAYGPYVESLAAGDYTASFTVVSADGSPATVEVDVTDDDGGGTLATTTQAITGTTDTVIDLPFHALGSCHRLELRVYVVSGPACWRQIDVH